jgi:4-amino-4-deoxy-L-arabinose transferase-like glycosyltransferase
LKVNTDLLYRNKFTYFSACLFIVFFFTWDLSNLEGLRQGTEGFYLQISKEMYNAESYLTPLYRGGNHWSKPPLHFWLPMPLYSIAGMPTIFTARLSVALISLLGIMIFSRWIRRQFSIPTIYGLLFFSSAFVFMKYARIYMMEMPLTLLTASSVLYFYTYLKENKSSDLLLASLLLGLSILIKGPVSLAMAGFSIGLYFLYLLTRRRNIFLPALKFGLAGLAIGSIWFIACYLKYGNEFFEYFFIRENLGKFSSKPYPMRHVFQGLIIFGLPWSLFLPFIYFYFKDNIKDFFKNEKFDAIIFLFLNFLAFFVLWLIPNQRSHHYAVPALPFLLSIILVTTFNPNYEVKRLNLFKFTNKLFAGILVLLSITMLSIFKFQEIQTNVSSIILILIALSIFTANAFIFIKNKHNILKFFSTFVSFGYLWVFLIPSFTLPYIPSEVISAVGEKSVAVVARKPYFIEEALGKTVDVLSDHSIHRYIEENTKYYIVHESVYKKQGLADITQVVKKWTIWLNRRRASHIFDALKKGSIVDLQEEMYLLKNN